MELAEEIRLYVTIQDVLPKLRGIDVLVDGSPEVREAIDRLERELERQREAGVIA